MSNLRVDTLPTGFRQDIRAAQRTFEGAYLRTAITNLSFGLIILRLFSSDFLAAGTLYTVHSILMLCLSYYERNRLERYFEETNYSVFVTGGWSVPLSSSITLAAHFSLLVILFRMDD